MILTGAGRGAVRSGLYLVDFAVAAVGVVVAAEAAVDDY